MFQVPREQWRRWCRKNALLYWIVVNSLFALGFLVSQGISLAIAAVVGLYVAHDEIQAKPEAA